MMDIFATIFVFAYVTGMCVLVANLCNSVLTGSRAFCSVAYSVCAWPWRCIAKTVQEDDTALYNYLRARLRQVKIWSKLALKINFESENALFLMTLYQVNL